MKVYDTLGRRDTDDQQNSSAGRPSGYYFACVEMGTTAGLARVLVLQWTLSDGLYTVGSHVRHVQVVCRPPSPRQAWCPTSLAPRVCPFVI